MAVVDIAIPCYRYGHFLKDCIESIQAQSLCDVRMLIIDDASPDGSAEAARALAARDPRIEVIVHERNRGALATYDEGIAWSKSPYLLLLSADDFLAPGALARAASIMNAHPKVALTYGRSVDLHENDPEPTFSDPDAPPEWRVRSGEAFIREHCERVRNLVPTPAAVVRTAVQKRVGGYDRALPHAGDMEMWMRLAAYGDVADTPLTQAVYRLHGSNMSRAYYARILVDYEQRALAFDTLFKHHGPRIPNARAHHALARRRLAEAAYWTGVARCCRGDMAIGRELLGFGLSLRPRMRLLPPVGQLFRHDRPDQKIASVLSDALRRLALRAGLVPQQSAERP